MPQMAKGSQEDFLSDVFGILTMAEHSQAESKHHALKLLDQPSLADTVTSQATLD